MPYDSVWYNQTEDVHPPLYYVILHTISSIFSGRFSWYWAYIINIICFVISQIFLYKIFSQFGKSYFLGVVICAFWGFTIGGQNMIYFLRMYAMLTMFSILYVYISQLILCEKENLTKKYYVLLGIVALFGALTQHYFLVFAFAYTFLQCIILFFKKSLKKMLAYGSSAAIGVGLSILAFPATLTHMFTSTISWSGEIDPYIQLHLLKRIIVRELTGYKMSIYRFTVLPYILMVLVIIVMVCIMLGILFRNEEWFKRFINKIKEQSKSCITKIKNADFSVIIMVISSVFVVYVNAYTAYYFDQNDYSNRYFFAIMPFLVGAVISALYIICKNIGKNRFKKINISVLCVLLAGVLIYQNIVFSPNYLLKADTDNGRINTYVENRNCLLILSSPIFLPCYCQMLEDAGSIYFTLFANNEYKSQQDEYEKLFSDDTVYLLFDMNSIISAENEALLENDTDNNLDSSDDSIQGSGLDEIKDDRIKESDIIEYFENVSGRKATYCTKENTHFCTVKLYKFELTE